MRSKLLPLAVSLTLLAACAPTNNTTGGSTAGDASSSAMAMEKEVTVTWDTREEEPGPYDEPRFTLLLVLSEGGEVEVGTYSGSFSDEQAAPKCADNDDACDDILLDGMSWWAGAGDEFVVRQKSGKLDVLHRETDEMTEVPRVFTSVKTVTLPAGATAVAGK